MSGYLSEVVSDHFYLNLFLAEAHPEFWSMAFSGHVPCCNTLLPSFWEGLFLISKWLKTCLRPSLTIFKFPLVNKPLENACSSEESVATIVFRKSCWTFGES